MFRLNYPALLLVFFVASFVAIFAHAQTTNSAVSGDFSDEYCFREDEGDRAIHDTFTYPDFVPAVIECETATPVFQSLIGMHEAVEVVKLSCNPAQPTDCSSNNIDYKNFEVTFDWKNPFDDAAPLETHTVKLLTEENSEVASVQNGWFKVGLKKIGSKGCFTIDGDFSLFDGITNTVTNMTSHCIFLPPPQVSYQLPQWGTLIAEVCLDYTKRHSKSAIPISSVVVECVETTMTNIFALTGSGETLNQPGEQPLFLLNDPNNYQKTFFSVVQERLRGFVLAALVLYVTIFGLNVVIGQKIPSKGDFIMAVLKFALVLYFTLGTGIVDFVPRLIDMSKTLSIVLMEASQNMPIDYKYCDFEGEVYEPGFETMRLWDVVDCKITKYLGFREGPIKNAEGEPLGYPNDGFDDIVHDNLPKNMIVSFVFWGGYGAGIIVFIFAFASGVFIITLAIRIVHVYIIAIMVIYFLAFLAPLIIPAALFQYTKDIFDNWLKQIISFSLQPVILFGFLAVLFAVSDFVMFRGNTEFCAQNDSIRMLSQTFDPDTRECSGTTEEIGDKWQCSKDDKAPGCIIMKHISLFSYKSKIGTNITTWQAYGASEREVMLSFMQLFFVFFVLSSMIPTIEELSHRLTDASGGGAVEIAGKRSKVSSPAATLGNTLNPAAKAAGTLSGMMKKIKEAKKQDPNAGGGGAGGMGAPGGGGGGGR